MTIPVIGTSFQVGQDLLAAGITVHIVTDTFGEIRSTANVIADLAGKRQRVIQVGAHLDSVPEGPGINDNGSGSAAILEVAIQMAHTTPVNTVRFSWWGAEEANLVGSTFYVDDLAADAPQQLNRIKAYLNFDMVGSPNFARFVYDGDQSTFPEDLVPIPAGSAEIEDVFERYYADRNLAFEDTAFDGRSDYQAFALAGIPSGGLFTGAEDVKTDAQAAAYGGTAGRPSTPATTRPATPSPTRATRCCVRTRTPSPTPRSRWRTLATSPATLPPPRPPLKRRAVTGRGSTPSATRRSLAGASLSRSGPALRPGWRGAGGRSSRRPASPRAGSSARHPTGSRGQWRSPDRRTTRWDPEMKVTVAGLARATCRNSSFRWLVRASSPRSGSATRPPPSTGS